MGKRVLNADILSQKSLRQLQKDLQAYQQDIIQKTKELAKQLAEIGVKVAQAKIDESPLGKYVTLKTDITEGKAGCKAILIATGEVKKSEGYADFNTLLSIEFGAGIHYNKTPNPNADKFGLGVGTFPGQVHAYEDFWFYWDDKQQKWMPTHGVKATMPMYSASMEIQKSIVDKAREVFGRQVV